MNNHRVSVDRLASLPIIAGIDGLAGREGDCRAGDHCLTSGGAHLKFTFAQVLRLKVSRFVCNGPLCPVSHDAHKGDGEGDENRLTGKVNLHGSNGRQFAVVAL